jgi:SSS family solute:Na+ symporter
MTQLQPLDFWVLLVYFAGAVTIGLWVGRRSGNPEAFMAAGRRIPGWAVGLSIFGTYVSSISFLALPSKAYASDWNAFVFSVSIPLTTWIAVKYFVPFYRRAGALSSYEHLEYRFGPWARTYSVLCYLLTQLARMGTIMFLLALVLAPLTGWSIASIIVLTGVVVIAYTLLGGMTAVIWTDVVQSLIFIVGAVTCVIFLLWGMPQGPAQLFGIAASSRKFSLGSFGASLSLPTFWVVLVYGIFINLQNFGIDQNYVQRYQTAKTEAEAAKSVWLGALLYLPISAIFFFIGTGLYAYYTARPDLLPASLISSPDAVFPYFITHQLPIGLRGLVIAAIFAAAQSTLSSSINCSATLVLCDLYKRYLRPGAGERESMWVLWMASTAVGIAGIAMALAMIHIRQALDAWWELAGIFSGGMLGLFTLGILSRRADNPAAACGVTAGVLIIAWMSLSPRLRDPWTWARSPFHGFLVVVIGTLTILLVGLFFSILKGNRPTAHSALQPK